MRSKSYSELVDLQVTNPLLYGDLLGLLKTRDLLAFNILQLSSIKYLLRIYRSGGSTMALSALRTGGRACNERPENYRLKNVFDIDIQSAYGKTLEKTILPLGKSRIYSKSPNAEQSKKFSSGAAKPRHK